MGTNGTVAINSAALFNQALAEIDEPVDVVDLVEQTVKSTALQSHFAKMLRNTQSANNWLNGQIVFNPLGGVRRIPVTLGGKGRTRTEMKATIEMADRKMTQQLERGAAVGEPGCRLRTGDVSWKGGYIGKYFQATMSGLSGEEDRNMAKLAVDLLDAGYEAQMDLIQITFTKMPSGLPGRGETFELA